MRSSASSSWSASRAGRRVSSRAIRRSGVRCACARIARTRSSTARSNADCCASNCCRRPSSPMPRPSRRTRLEAARARPGAAMFGNRLRKNFARLEAWAKRQDVACFRVYDADMPEYAFAIDLYGNDERWAYVQEYAAPATVAQDAARGRRDEVLAVLPEVLGLPRGACRAARAPAPARRRAVREGGRGGAIPHGARRALPVPGELHRLPRHRAVPGSPAHAPTHRRTRRRALVPEPVRLHRHRHRARGRRRRHVLDDRGHVAHLPRLGEAQPGAERPRGPAARLRAGRLPRLARAAGRALRRSATGSSSSIRRRCRARSAWSASSTCSATTRVCSSSVARLLEPRRPDRVLEQFPEVQARPGACCRRFEVEDLSPRHAAGGFRAQSAHPRLLFCCNPARPE